MELWKEVEMKNSYQPKVIHYLYSSQPTGFIHVGEVISEREELPYLTYIMNEYKRSWMKSPHPHYLSDFAKMISLNQSELELELIFYLPRSPEHLSYQKIIMELEPRKIKHWGKWFKKLEKQGNK